MAKKEEDLRRKREMKWRLTGLSFREIHKGLSAAAGHQDVEDALKPVGEKWEAGHLLECWIADCLTLPIDEQIRRAKRGQAIIERIRLRDVPGPPLGPDDDAVQDASLEAGNHCEVPRVQGRAGIVRKPRANPDAAIVLGARPILPRKKP